MIIITTESGQEFTIKEDGFCENARQLINLLQDDSNKPRLLSVQSTDGTHILAKYIVTAKDVQID